MSKPIALLFGVGKNIGAHTAKTFQAKGYRIAQAARSLKAEDSNETTLSIPCDLAHAKNVESVFEKVRKEWGEPSVVIYNAAAAVFTKPDEYLNISTEDFERVLAINTSSSFVAAREALASFQTFPKDQPKTFLYTGNMTNEGPVPLFLTLGIGKTGSAYYIQIADSLYREQGMRFFYVDERQASGTFMRGDNPLGGQAHADMFLSLAERTAGEVPWQCTFVKDQGYTEFPHKTIM